MCQMYHMHIIYVISGAKIDLNIHQESDLFSNEIAGISDRYSAVRDSNLPQKYSEISIGEASTVHEFVDSSSVTPGLDPMELYHSIYHEAPIFYSSSEEKEHSNLGLTDSLSVSLPTLSLPQQCVELLQALLQKNPSERCSVQQIKNSSMITTLEKSITSGEIHRSRDVFLTSS